MRLMRSVLLLSLSVAAISPSSSNAQDLLRWKLNRGETLNYTVQQKMEMSVNVAGTDVTNTINQKMGMVWNISEIAASGDVIMNQVINRIQLRMENSQTGTAEFDTQDPNPPENPLMKAMADTFGNIVGKEFTVTMKPTGKVDEVSIPKELLDAIRNSSAGVPGSLDETALKQMMKQTAVTLPDQEVSPGDTWTTSQKMELPFGTMELSPRMTYRGRESDTNLAIIDFTPSVTLQPKEDAPVAVSLESSDGAGRVKFDINTGRVDSMLMKMTMTLSSEAQGQKFQQTVKQSTSMTLAK